MIKKCIVQYDELEKPIGLIELKEFASTPELRQFLENCEKNKLLYKKRLEKKAEKELLEKQKMWQHIENLDKKIEGLKQVIWHLLGNRELSEEEIKKFLEEDYEKEEKC